jgi:hypothetical protein
MLDAHRQCDSPQEIAQVVRQHEQLQSHLIVVEAAERVNEFETLPVRI